MSNGVYDAGEMMRAASLGYGMPHIGCTYTGDNVSKTAFQDDWTPCAVCGGTATNRHHEPPRSRHSAEDPSTARKRRGSILLKTEWGRFVLKPALIALCGSGTTGCHARRHNGDIEIEWRFDTEEDAREWASGRLLAHGWIPHTERLYGMGCWHFHDKATGRRWEHRGGGY